MAKQRKKSSQMKLNTHLGLKLTQSELEAHLWESVNILRGSVDTSEYKNYIFRPLLLKRLSDVFEEEAEKILQEMDVPEIAKDPDEHEIFVPKSAQWSELRKVTQDIGNALNKACKAVEEYNPVLEVVLVSIDFNAKNCLLDGNLSWLLQHLSIHRLRNSNLCDPDILGRSYEYLAVQFAELQEIKETSFILLNERETHREVIAATGRNWKRLTRFGVKLS